MNGEGPGDGGLESAPRPETGRRPPPASRRADVPAGAHGERRIQTICLLVLTMLAIAAAMQFLSRVLIPFVLAIFLTYCLSPVINVQMRWLRLPRVVAIVSTVLLGCVALFLVGLLIMAAVDEIRAHADAYRRMFEGMIEQSADRLTFEGFGIDGPALTETLLKRSGEAASKLLTGTVTGIMSIVSNGLLVIIFMVFLLAGRQAPPAAGSGLWYEIEARTKRYIITMVLISTTTGLLVGATLTVLGVDFAWMFGFLAFLLNFIPNIGSIVATLLPIPVALLDEQLTPLAKVLAVVIPALIQFGIGSLLAPKLMGQSLDLHPVTVLMSLMFFGVIWGIVGMFLAVPIAAILKILFERIEHTRPLAEVMAGRLDAIGAGRAGPDHS